MVFGGFVKLIMNDKIIVKCKKCESAIDLHEVGVKKEIFKFEGRQSMWLTYFDCPVCGERYFCQIDNEESNSKLNEVTTIIARIARYKKSGRAIPKKLQSKYNRYSEELRELRKALAEKYNNCWFEDAQKHSLKVKFYG